MKTLELHHLMIQFLVVDTRSVVTTISMGQMYHSLRCIFWRITWRAWVPLFRRLPKSRAGIERESRATTMVRVFCFFKCVVFRPELFLTRRWELREVSSVCVWTSRHQILKSKTKEPLKDFSSSGIRGTNKIYICLQLPSSLACFVWKPAHFEFPSYGGD